MALFHPATFSPAVSSHSRAPPRTSSETAASSALRSPRHPPYSSLPPSGNCMGAGLLCCLGTRRQARPPQRLGDQGGEGEPSERFLDGGTQTQWSGRSTSAAQRKMPTARRWMRGMNRIFARQLAAVAADADGPTSLRTATTATAAQVGEEEEGGRAVDRELSRDQQAAAATIQACFRRHLARRALRALRSLVKMQAFARGAYVRKQADVAIRFMKVLVRLQVRVRARQLLHISRDQRSTSH